MGDIICRVCGEPWDAYGVIMSLRKPEGDDLTPQEARDLLAGRGCPCCRGQPPEDLTEDEREEIEEDYWNSLLEELD
jgi:hypothetical protein